MFLGYFNERVKRHAMLLEIDSEYKMKIVGFMRLNRPIILTISKSNGVN